MASDLLILFCIFFQMCSWPIGLTKVLFIFFRTSLEPQQNLSFVFIRIRIHKWNKKNQVKHRNKKEETPLMCQLFSWSSYVTSLIKLILL